jgi:hypothetical protein
MSGSKRGSSVNELSVAVYQATTSWPKAELFGLSAQARRAAHSAAANIAEGSARRRAGGVTWLLYKVMAAKKGTAADPQ